MSAVRETQDDDKCLKGGKESERLLGNGLAVRTKDKDDQTGRPSESRIDRQERGWLAVP